MAKETVKKTAEELKHFGKVMCLVLVIFGAVLLYKEKFASVYFFFGALFFLGFGILAPGVLAPVERGWMWLGKKLEPVGIAITCVIMSMVFYFVVTPIGLFMRLIGKDLLQLKLEPERESYWEPVEVDGPGTRFYTPY